MPTAAYWAPGVVAVLVALAHGGLVGFAGDLHVAAGGHDHEVVALVVGPFAGVAEGRYGGRDQAGVVGAEGVEADAEVVEVVAVETLDDYVGVGGKAAEQIASGSGFEVQSDGTLVGVVEQEVEAAVKVGVVVGKWAEGGGTGRRPEVQL